MIMKFTSSSYEYAGRVNDEIWLASGLRGIARRRIRPATRETKLEFRALFSLSLARVEWANLGSSTQAEWSDIAATTFGWPLQGSPRYMNGETFFINYYTVLLTLDEYASVPDPPEEGPDWQTKPKFFEFAQWTDDIYNLKAETEFDTDTQLLFSGLPPSRTGYKPDFAREVFIGNEQLYDGLEINQLYAEVGYMMENAFGTIDPTQKIWGRIWEIYPETGYIRTIKDPCTPDPNGEAPTQNTLDFIIYNDYFEDIYYGDFATYNGDYGINGFHEIDYLGAFEQLDFTITLDDEATLEDVAFIVLFVDWDDEESLEEEFDYYGEQPYELTLQPSI